MSSNRYVRGAGTLDMTVNLFQLRFQENCSFLSCTRRRGSARMGRSRASALMKFTRTITITKVERRFVGVVPTHGSPADPCQAPAEAALPVAEESLGLPA